MGQWAAVRGCHTDTLSVRIMMMMLGILFWGGGSAMRRHFGGSQISVVGQNRPSSSIQLCVASIGHIAGIGSEAWTHVDTCTGLVAGSDRLTMCYV
jgi:hypothetical protein